MGPHIEGIGTFCWYVGITGLLGMLIAGGHFARGGRRAMWNAAIYGLFVGPYMPFILVIRGLLGREDQCPFLRSLGRHPLVGDWREVAHLG
jgi:hypothetical protein